MKAAMFSFGCRLNFSETETVSGSLVKKGYEITEKVEGATLCVINTCTVTERSDAKCKKLIRHIQRRNPLAKIAVIGCYSQMSGEEIKDIGGVDIILGNEHKLYLSRYLDMLPNADAPIVETGKILNRNFTVDYSGRSAHVRANLKVQDGCDFYCSFCIIPFSRGRSRSRVFGDIMDEARKLAENGHSELVLTGVNIGTYRDEKYRLADVLDSLNKIDGIKRIRISSIEPTTVTDDVLAMMADSSSKVLPFLHLPMQSGNNDVLKDMRRKYAFEEYERFVCDAYERIPDVCIGTDVMTGFPTESDDCFEDTRDKLRRLPVHYFHVFPYSERKGTRSEKMPENVSPFEIQRRSLALRELSDAKRKDYYETYLGEELPVLFEDAVNGDQWRGYTPNYIRVVCPSDKTLRGEIRRCRITANNADHVDGVVVN